MPWAGASFRAAEFRAVLGRPTPTDRPSTQFPRGSHPGASQTKPVKPKPPKDRALSFEGGCGVEVEPEGQTSRRTRSSSELSHNTFVDKEAPLNTHLDDPVRRRKETTRHLIQSNRAAARRSSRRHKSDCTRRPVRNTGPFRTASEVACPTARVNAHNLLHGLCAAPLGAALACGRMRLHSCARACKWHWHM